VADLCYTKTELEVPEHLPTAQAENENNLTVVAGYLHSSKPTIATWL